MVDEATALTGLGSEAEDGGQAAGTIADGRRAVRTISPWCRSHPRDLIAEQHAVLCQKLRGHAAYYGITGNSPALARFRHEVLWTWRKWLLRRRRAWRARAGWFSRLLERYPVPYLRAVHSVYRGVANG